MSRFWPFRIFPKSLYGQILLVAASALLLAQGVNAALLLASTRSRAVAESTTMVVTRVANQLERQQERSGAFPGEPRERVINEGPRRRRGPPVSIEYTAQPIIVRRYNVEDELTGRADEFLTASNLGLSQIKISTGSIKLLPADLREPVMQRYMLSKMRQNRPEQPRFAVLMTARTADGRWLNAAALVRPTETGSLVALILQTLLLYVAVLIPLALVARRIAKPLSTLTARVQRVGLAEDVEPMPSEGPSDVRQLIDSFNLMHARVSTLLGEKDVMLGAIGHDLKTPLAALRVRVESVEDNVDREKMVETIDEMVTILDDILMLARLGKSGEAMQSVDIGALAESITGEFLGAAFIDPQSRVVAQVRPVLLRRALRNLISNAVTYGKNANVAVNQSGDATWVEISDDGHGIPLELIDGIFEPFARTDVSRNRATGGSGLGLTIARAIARSHNGDVSLNNRSEGGLRATISFKT
jgi:signal transduction histidine kinase